MKLVVGILLITFLPACAVIGLRQSETFNSITITERERIMAAIGAGGALLCPKAGGSTAACAALGASGALNGVVITSPLEMLDRGLASSPLPGIVHNLDEPISPHEVEDIPVPGKKSSVATSGSAGTGTGVAGSAIREINDYKVILGADSKIKMPGPPGELRIWIGNPGTSPGLPSYMRRAEGILPRVGQTAKITAFAPAFEIEPLESICMRIDPTGSVVRFKLKPTKLGTFNVGADINLFDSTNCSGAAVPKATETLQVEVIVDSEEVFQEHTKQLSNVFWDKFLQFWGVSTALFFALLLFLIKRKLKKRFSFENNK